MEDGTGRGGPSLGHTIDHQQDKGAVWVGNDTTADRPGQ
jgi:hypothetical protein